MNIKECLRFLGHIKAMFPNEKELTPDEMRTKAEIWADVMSELTYEQACSGLKKYCAASTSGFAPQPAHILNYARAQNRLSDAAITFYISRALCDSIYHSKEQFAGLPDDLKRIVGSPVRLRQQAARPQDDSNIYIKSIIKEYRIRVDGGTLDNTLLVSAEENACIGRTMARLTDERT